MLRAAGLVSAAVMLSRVLGLVREQVFAALLGAGLYADAFQAAFRIPNLLRDLFAEGALSAAFVPTYARVLAEAGPRAAFRLASRLLTLLAVSLGGLILVGYVGAGPLVGSLASGFEVVPGKFDVTVRLTRIMLPFLPLVSFAAVVMGMLNAHGRFGVAAVAPALFNLVTILWAGLLWTFGAGPETVVVGWAFGTLLGGAAQLLVQVPSLWRAGWRWAPEWAPRDPNLGAIFRLMTPAVVGLAAVQINIFVSTSFASEEPGALSWLSYAFRVLYLPIGIFGVAAGTVATTGLAQRAAANDALGLATTLRRALGALAFLTIPATAGLIALAHPIVRLLFERGRFGPADTHATATALTLYALGLVCYSSVKVLAPVFYALGAPRVPLVASGAAVATNLAVVLALHHGFGFRAIALGLSLGALANVVVLMLGVRARVSGAFTGLASGMLRMSAAALVMAPCALALVALLEARIGSTGLLAQALTALVPIAGGIGLYGLVAWLLRVPELGLILGALRRRSA